MKELTLAQRIHCELWSYLSKHGGSFMRTFEEKFADELSDDDYYAVRDYLMNRETDYPSADLMSAWVEQTKDEVEYLYSVALIDKKTGEKFSLKIWGKNGADARRKVSVLYDDRGEYTWWGDGPIYKDNQLISRRVVR